MRLSETSVIIVTYNHVDYIKDCLDSLLEYPSIEIIVVDNDSTDGTSEFIQKNYDKVKIIRNKKNVGYGVGNNIGVNVASNKYVIILNPDTRVSKGAIEAILKPLEKKIVTIPKVLFYDGSKINTCGNIEHFTGLTFTRGLGEIPDKYNNPEILKGLSGVCFAMLKKDYLELGGFDDKFFVYMEDAEFSWKANLNGFKIIYVPDSIIYHDYVLEVSPEKIYHLEKGRYIIIRKYLSCKEILMISPSLICTEILTWGYSFLKGIDGIKHKLKAIIDGVLIEVVKFNGDRKNLLNLLNSEIPSNQLTNIPFAKYFIKFANFIYKLNLRMLI